MTLVPGLNHDPVGKATITDVNGGVIRTGDMLKASIAGVTDADGITGDIRYTWQAEFTAGTGVFEDIVLLPGRRPRVRKREWCLLPGKPGG